MSNSEKDHDADGNGIEHPILKKLPFKIRQEISRMMEERIFPAGTTIFEQGDPGDCFFMIKSGKVRIFRETKDLMMTELSHLGPGDSFGEMALLTGAPRAATVEAVKDTRLAVLSKTQFDKILQQFPEVSLSLIIQMASWLIENDQMLKLEKTRKYQPAKVSVLDFFLILGLSVLCAVIFNHSNPNGIDLFSKIVLNPHVDEIPPNAAITDFKLGNAIFVDARPSELYNESHIPGAINLPISLFDIMYMMSLSDMDKSRKTIVYGRTISGKYDVEAANKLYLRGHKNIFILKGGIPSWKKEGGSLDH
jgi:CRP-like cAMP-binding protein/rhodanese-related sulfurtransferase